MERKLASVQTITEVVPIEDADNIEMVKVMGWQCVAKRGEFSEGDLCVYCEVDSILPDEDWCAFLGDNKRIRTRKFRGQISQGIVFPRGLLDPLINYEIGEDVTEVLRITKYEPPMKFSAGDAAGAYPTNLGFQKTDESRIQSTLKLLGEMYGLPYYISQKIDGTSTTIYWDSETNELTVCSRNMKRKAGDNVYWRVALANGLDTKLSGNGFNRYALQAEVYGEGIQGNKLDIKGQKMAVFSVYDLEDKTYLGLVDAVNVCTALNLDFVPVLEQGEFFAYTLDQLLEKAKGKYPGGKHQEGIVIRPVNYTYSKTLVGMLSFKVINNDFLLKYDA